jgi:hypothetical protein
MVPRGLLTVKQEAEFLGLTGLPSWNGDHHVENNDEQRDHRRLDPEWEHLGRNARLKVDIHRHKHHKEEARAREQQSAAGPFCRQPPQPWKQEKNSRQGLTGTLRPAPLTTQ